MLTHDEELKIEIIQNYADFKIDVLKNKGITPLGLQFIQDIHFTLLRFKNSSDPFIKRYQNKLLKYMKKFKNYVYDNLDEEDYSIYIQIFDQIIRRINNIPRVVLKISDVYKNNEDDGEYQNAHRLTQNDFLSGTFSEDIEYLKE